MLESLEIEPKLGILAINMNADTWENNGGVCCRIFIVSLIRVQVILKYTSEYVHESIFLSREIHLERGSQHPTG